MNTDFQMKWETNFQIQQ